MSIAMFILAVILLVLVAAGVGAKILEEIGSYDWSDFGVAILTPIFLLAIALAVLAIIDFGLRLA